MNKLNINVERVFNAEIAKVYDAFADAEKMSKWFYATGEGGSSQIESDFKEGGRYHICMIRASGETHDHSGIYTKIVPNKEIFFTWNSEMVQDTEVQITLESISEGTRVKLTHVSMPEGEPAEMHTVGWNAILELWEQQSS